VSSAIFLRHTPSSAGFADQPAVVAGLSMPYSNDPIEGANTKVKLLKRQMYGRAGFPVLRQRILLS
jgi:transposase